MTYSSNAALIATSSLVATTITVLNEKDLLTTAEAGGIIRRAYDNAKAGSPMLAEEIRKIYKDLFPNVTLAP